MKTEVVIEEGARILSISKPYRGRISDLRIKKRERYLILDVVKYAGSRCRS